MTTRRSGSTATAEQLAPELLAAREAAEVVLAAQAAGDGDAAAEEAAKEAAKAALDAGHPLSAVAAAEQAGQQAARDRVGPQLLREVERTAKRLREATRDHEAAIVRAARAGLADRQVAERAQIAHATVRSIVRRHADGAPERAVDGSASDGQAAPAAPTPPAAEVA